MPQAPSKPGGVLPPWLIAAGSLAILYHLAAIIVPILDTPSGPWPTPFGRNVADPPQFAHAASGLATVQGKYLRVAHSYHFVTNRPGDVPGVEFEVRLKNDKGEVTDTLRFPDPHANPWVRHRQEVLASALAPDFPVEPQGGEVIAAPGQKTPTVSVWMMPGEKLGASGPQPPAPPPDHKMQLQLRTVPQHLVPRTRAVMRPSEWSLVLARSYARHLCREHGAAAAEIVRHTREPVSPAVLFGMKPPPQAFDELVATFDSGETAPSEEKSR